jgi:hypothetical protein
MVGHGDNRSFGRRKLATSDRILTANRHLQVADRGQRARDLATGRRLLNTG